MDEEKKQTVGGEIENKKSSIRTYESDAASALKESNASLGSVFLAEQKEGGVANLTAPKNKPKSISYIVTTLLIVLGLGALVFSVYFFLKRIENNVEVPVNEYGKTVIADREIVIETNNLSSVELLDNISSLRQTLNENLGSITSLIFVDRNLASSTSRMLTASEFVQILDLRMPGRLERNLSSNYAIGIHAFDGNEPFVVFGLNAYEEAFAGMLEWETLLLDDLTPFFEELVEDVESEDVSTTTVEVASPVFVDMVIRNKDARALKYQDQILLLYSFADRKSLIITTNENTFREVMSRLSPERF